MNREIKFRGKHIHATLQNEHLDGRWIYGYLCDLNYINSPELEGEFLVSTETIEQYTGLNDKNGKEIWENDRCCVQRTGILAYGTIKYLEGCFCFVEDKTGNTLRLCDISKNNYSIKVEGNIFDKT